MATVTHYIRSDYDPEVDKDRLLRETGQSTDDDVDPWQTESSSAGFHNSHRLANAPKFVPAALSYDEWGTAAAPSYSERGTLSQGDVASWYRSLSRQGATSPKQQEQEGQSQLSPHSHPTAHRSSKASPEPPIASSSSISPSITRPASSSANSANLAATSSSSAQPAPLSTQRRVGRDWFIARAISQSQSASAPSTPRPRSGSSGSLADILERHPPSTNAQPFRPPVFLHLGPSNKGWAMLQNQGWSEGEGLGTSTSSRSGIDASNNRTEKEQKARKRSRLDRLSPPSSPSREQPEATEEHILVGGDDDDDDPIIEVRKKAHVPTIDLTRSDTEEDEDEEDEEDDRNNDSPVSPASADDDPTRTTSTSTTVSDPRGTQTALLTPLPTVLKSDRLGIGLKAKTEGPYRSSVKRVTRSEERRVGKEC